MKLVLEIPDNKVAFFMELIQNLSFVKITKTDTTEYLLRGNNGKRLLNSIEQLNNGELLHKDIIEA